MKPSKPEGGQLKDPVFPFSPVFTQFFPHLSHSLASLHKVCLLMGLPQIFHKANLGYDGWMRCIQNLPGLSSSSIYTSEFSQYLGGILRKPSSFALAPGPMVPRCWFPALGMAGQDSLSPALVMASKMPGDFILPLLNKAEFPSSGKRTASSCFQLFRG